MARVKKDFEHVEEKELTLEEIDFENRKYYTYVVTPVELTLKCIDSMIKIIDIGKINLAMNIENINLDREVTEAANKKLLTLINSIDIGE